MNSEFTTSLARCWKITRADGKIFTFTDHDSVIEINGLIYKSDTAISVSAVESSIGFDSDNIEIQCAFSDDQILHEEVERGLFEKSDIKAFEYDWRAKIIVRDIFDGQLDEYSFSSQTMNLEAHTKFDKINNVFGRGFHRACDAELGDNNCRYNLETSGMIYVCEFIEFAGFDLFTSAVDDAPEGWFNNGVLELVRDTKVIGRYSIRTDTIIGERRKLTIWNRVSEANFSNCTLRLIVGCEKSIKCCGDRFQNAINFQGFPTIPNDDWLAVSQDGN